MHDLEAGMTGNSVLFQIELQFCRVTDQNKIAVRKVAERGGQSFDHHAGSEVAPHRIHCNFHTPSPLSGNPDFVFYASTLITCLPL